MVGYLLYGSNEVWSNPGRSGSSFAVAPCCNSQTSSPVELVPHPHIGISAIRSSKVHISTNRINITEIISKQKNGKFPTFVILWRWCSRQRQRSYWCHLKQTLKSIKNENVAKISVRTGTCLIKKMHIVNGHKVRHVHLAEYFSFYFDLSKQSFRKLSYSG